MQIGLIGAGLMGRGIVSNLLKHGHSVRVIAHKNRKPIDELVKLGAVEVKDLAGIAQAEVIFLCVSTSNVVDATIAKLRPHLRKGRIIIDAGTTEPAVTRRLAGELAQLGVGYADAPMTGGPEQSEAAELGVLCGADAETFAVIEPLFKCYATTIRHFGEAGTGHTAKLISNFLVTGMVALVAEAFDAAFRAGIDWRNLYEVMLNGSGNSGVLRKMVGPALDGNFGNYRFSVDNANKDIGYYGELAKELGCDGALNEALTAFFAKAVKDKRGHQHVSQLLERK